jgi:phosphopantothenoylcysteine decarboxylase/phosphopantothenate--cysteine ligase
MTDTANLCGRRILVGVTGGIAAYKTAELVRGLKKAGAEVQVLMTRDARRFVTELTLGTLSEREVLTDIFPENETGSWTKHVHLGRWGDLLVIAPLTANTLAKLAHGACDSMLTAVALSAACPMLVCPAMDHDMYGHPAVRANLAALESRGVAVMPAEFGELASGLHGQGRMPEPDAILARIAELLGGGPLAGVPVLVTAGPTREAVDPVRFLSNRSTGTMGLALAEEAARRGARVTLVAGPGVPASSGAVERIDVESADDMHAAVMARADASVVIGAAAVADYAPKEPSASKVSKSEGDLSLALRRTPDILLEVGRSKRPGQVLVGFALETDDGEARARSKLERKNLDLIVLNDPDEPGAGFGTETNRVTVFGRDGSVTPLPVLPKAEVAARILDLVAALGA